MLSDVVLDNAGGVESQRYPVRLCGKKQKRSGRWNAFAFLFAKDVK